MNRIGAFLVVIVLGINGYGQKYTTKSGELKFEASASSFEEVKAVNNKTSAVLESLKGDLAVLSLIKNFHFKSALMEEHFNENYMESDKFPKATFVGKIDSFNISDVTSSIKSYKLSGELTLHGKTKKVSTTVMMSMSSDNILLAGSFEVRPEEYGIEIPRVMWNKIAEKVVIKYNLTLTKQ